MDKRLSKLMTASFLILVLLITPGCWDNRDFSKILFVAAVGLDKTEDNKIQLTLQLINPISGDSEQGNEKSSVWVVSFSGETVMDAVRNALSTANRQPNYSQTILLVIGEDLAKDGVMQALDIFSRDHEIRKKIRLLIAKDTTAYNVLNLESTLESIPAVQISEILDNEKASPKCRNVELFDVLKDLSEPGINPTIGVIETRNGKKLEDIRVSGAAAFNKDKLAGYLDPIQTMGLLFILNKIKSGDLNIVNPLDPSKKMTIEIKSSQTEIDVTGYEKTPTLKIKVKLTGNIADAQGVQETLDKGKKEVIEQETAAKINEIIFSTIKQVQNEIKCDIFGFGQKIWEKDPEQWTALHEHWDEKFSQAEIEIEAESKLKSPGLITKPIKPQ